MLCADGTVTKTTLDCMTPTFVMNGKLVTAKYRTYAEALASVYVCLMLEL